MPASSIAHLCRTLLEGQLELILRVTPQLELLFVENHTTIKPNLLRRLVAGSSTLVTKLTTLYIASLDEHLETLLDMIDSRSLSCHHSVARLTKVVLSIARAGGNFARYGGGYMTELEAPAWFMLRLQALRQSGLKISLVSHQGGRL